MPRARRPLWGDLWLWLGIVLLDQATKYVSLQVGEIGSLSLVGSLGSIDLFFAPTVNRGAAWGAFAEYPRVLMAVRFFFLMLLASMYRLSKNTYSIRLGLTAVLAGACSNIIDTIFRGHVIDMILVRLWGWDYPVFNVADMAICVGAVYVAIDGLLFEKVEKGR